MKSESKHNDLFQENAFENVVCNTVVLLFRSWFKDKKYSGWYHTSCRHQVTIRYHQTSSIKRTKSQYLNVLRLVWVINNFIAYWGATCIQCLAVRLCDKSNFNERHKFSVQRFYELHFHNFTYLSIQTHTHIFKRRTQCTAWRYFFRDSNPIYGHASAHFGLMTPFGVMELSQHWFRQWFVAHGTKALPEPMLTNNQWDLVAFTWGQFHRN